MHSQIIEGFLNVFDMNDLPLLILIASIIGLSILTTNWYFNSVMAVTIRGASVIQEQVNTGNPILDKEINKFYSCISKIHQDKAQTDSSRLLFSKFNCRD